MIKNPLLDGWEHYGQDLWQAAVNKMFWKNRVSVSLMYIPPFRFGIRREQKSVISTDFMDIQKRQSMRTYDNTLLLRVRFRLDNRKKTHRIVACLLDVSSGSSDKPQRVIIEA